MLTAIFKIIELVLRMVDRRLSRLDAEAEEILDEKYRKALADNDYSYASYLLQRRMRRKNRSAKGQGADKSSSNRPG